MRIGWIITWFLLSFAATIASLAYQRPYRAIVGNVCERSTANPLGHCYGDLPAGGFPLPFLYDSPNTSVVGQLGIEDAMEYQNTLSLSALISDWAFFATALAFIWILFNRRMKTN